MNIKLTWRIWVFIIVTLLSIMSIFGTSMIAFKQGVLVTSVDANSAAFEQGLRKGQIITDIDGQKISSVQDFTNSIMGKNNLTGNVKTTIKTDNSEIIIFSNKSLGISVSEIPKTNLKLGLDLSGGARALVKAQNISLSPSDAQDLSQIIKNRLNVYGIEDIKVSPVSDLSGNSYIKIEIAGATPEDLENLVSQQGKFEAKIGNEIAFIGGKKDITSVARSGQEAMIESCQKTEGGFFCNFRFTIYLSEEAAQRHAQITEKLEVNTTLESGKYLSEKLDLFLDDKLVDSLLISEGLKGRVTTQISISGSGTGFTQEQAYDNAIDEMNNLQTILITGSLPYKLEIVKLDTLSPVLGQEFIKYILLAGVSALFAVFLVVLFRYRKIKASLFLLITSFSEIIIILGIAAFIDWNLDLPSIAGILATIGTGIDQQIIVLDETKEKSLNIRQRLKRAFAIILGAYFTGVVAMIPLFWASAGLFKGFATTTIIGITIGVLITRPAFTDMIGKSEE